jgi:hypothetical protein
MRSWPSSQRTSSARREGADEDHGARVLADVDEAAGPGQARAELADVEVAVLVGLRQAQDGDVEPAAVVEVELAGLVDDGLRVHRRAKVQPAGRNAADHAGLGGQREQVNDALLGRHAGHALGHADAQVHHLVRAQFECGTARNDLALAQAHRQHALHRHADLRRKGRVVGLDEGLHVVRRVDGHHHGVHQHARHLHLARVQRAAFGNALDLRDHHAARVARGHRNGQGFERQRLALHGQVAVGIGRGGADDADLDGEGLVEQVVLAVDRHHAHQVFGGARIELAAAVARIDEGVQPHAGQRAGLAGGDVAKQVGDHALRQVPGLDQVVDRELLHLGHQPPVAANDFFQQACVTQVVQPAGLAVALAGGVHQRQVARRLGLLEALFQRHGNRLGKPMPTKPPVATVSPSWISCTASAALTTLFL